MKEKKHQILMQHPDVMVKKQKEKFAKKISSLLNNAKTEDGFPISQTEIASMLDVSVASITRWINGERFPDEVNYKKIMELFAK